MRRAERIGYLSNLLLLMRQDGEIAPEELALIGEVRQELGISSEEQDEAEHLVEAGRAAWSLASRFSDCIRNLEDLVQLSLVDYTIQAREKEVVVEMARRVGVTQPQLDRIAREAQQRLKESRLSEAAVRCEFCGTRPVAGSRFCTDCGRPLPGVSLTDIGFPATKQGGPDAQPELPAQGITVLFPESTLQDSPLLRELLAEQPGKGELLLDGRPWHRIGWGELELEQAVPLLNILQLAADRRAFYRGIRRPWNEIFGFLGCLSRRSSSTNPPRYCFIGDDGLHIFGCIKSRMPWRSGADWLKIGKFVDTATFLFDRKQIVQELVQRLLPFRFCPALDRRYLTVVQQQLPERAVVAPGGPWQYREAEPCLGKAIEVSLAEPGTSGPSATRTMLVHGVQPTSDELGLEIVRLALANCGRGVEWAALRES